MQAEAPVPETEQNGESKPEEAKPAETALPQAPVILGEEVERVEEVQITKQSNLTERIFTGLDEELPQTPTIPTTSVAQALAIATTNDPQADPVDKIVKQLNQTDKLSVYVKNVEYKCTKKDLFEHFGVCGDITRATIIKNRYTGQAKGYTTAP